MLRLEIINERNLGIAIKTQNEIFPKYFADTNYIESVRGITNNKYYLLYDGARVVGISGIYVLDTDPESAWLGWFGIKKEYRKMGYGTQAIKQFENEARKNGLKHCRIYTDKYNNDSSIRFYKNLGYIEEDYFNEDDPACKKYPILILSKPLQGAYVPWGNKSIKLTEQIKKQVK